MMSFKYLDFLCERQNCTPAAPPVYEKSFFPCLGQYKTRLAWSTYSAALLRFALGSRLLEDETAGYSLVHMLPVFDFDGSKRWKRCSELGSMYIFSSTTMSPDFVKKVLSCFRFVHVNGFERGWMHGEDLQRS